MSKTALLIIDVQRAFFDGDPIAAVYDGDRVLERISSVVQRARLAGLPLVYVQHIGAVGHPLEPQGKGWQIHPEVRPQEADLVIGKTRPDSFYGTNLQADLDLLDAKKLIVMGNQTDFCIDTTCRRARSFDYEVTLLHDAHSTWDNKHLKARQIIDHHNFVLGRQFVSLVDSSRVDFERL